MKKFVSILMALLVAMSVMAVAVAEEETFTEPEGGRKFSTVWALAGGKVNVDFEEGGYRVSVDLTTDLEHGTLWQYNCYYVEADDTLESIYSSKTPYTLLNGQKELGEPEYEGMDEEGMSATFAINNGVLTWNEPHENSGADLEFRNIGNFEGKWINEAEEVVVEITWMGLDEDEFFYNVYITRGNEQSHTDFLMNGFYNEETGKLECMGTATTFTLNADGEYDTTEDNENYDAFFSELEDGKILFETANGIELEYSML